MRALLQATTSALLLVVIITISTSAGAADPLPSWNDGVTKQSIFRFVDKVNREGSPDFVLPAERIAVFDNDGRPLAPVRASNSTSTTPILFAKGL